MASPKNWERHKPKESNRTKYVWKHRDKQAWVMVKDVSRGKQPQYQVKIEGKTGTNQGSLNTYTNKQDARKRAVRWMRNHPHAGQKPKPDPQNEYIKVWKDDGRLRAGFFDSSNALVEEIPVEDTNSNDIDSLAKELQQAYDMRVKKGYGG